MKRCYSCGASVPDDAKFCAKCGKPLEITQDLIDRAKENDSVAQTELYERTYKIVYARTRAKIPNEDAVMDIMQETYLHAFTSLDQLQNAKAFPSWLLTIAGRQASNWYRKNGKEQENIQFSQLEYEDDDTLSDEDDLLEEPEDRSDLLPDQALDRAETGRLLSEILDTLPEDQRIILTMRYYDDMSLQEISEALGVNLSTVKSRLTAGKKKVEAKVLELEKSGTKLYSLGPIPFLIFLLHNAELFVPVIPANTIIGMTAAGAGAAAGAAATAGASAVSASAGAAAAVSGTAAKSAAVGAAVKAAAGAAVKGISVKAVAAVAAAVVVAGGGVTTAVIVNNQSKPEPPSDTVVMEMAENLSKWVANSDFGSERIDLDLDKACELSAIMVSECGYSGGEGITRTGSGDYDGYLSVIAEETFDQCLLDLFGSDYQASDFHNTEMVELIRSDYPDYSTDLNGYLVRDAGSDLQWYYTGLGDEDTLAEAEPGAVIDISPVDDHGDSYTATVRYDWYLDVENDNAEEPDEHIRKGSADVTFWLKYEKASKYNWVITSIQEDTFEESDEYIKYMKEQQDSADTPSPSFQPSPPSWEAVSEMADYFAYTGILCFVTNSNGYEWTDVTFEDACDATALVVYKKVGWESPDSSRNSFMRDDFAYIAIPEETVELYLRNLFGSEYQLSDYTRSEFHDNDNGYSNDYQLIRLDDGSYWVTQPNADDGLDYTTSEVLDISPDTENAEMYAAVVRYSYYHGESEIIYQGYRDITFRLKYDEGSDYNWVITAFKYGEFVQDESKEKDNVTPAAAEASNLVGSGNCGDGLTWTLEDNGTLTLSGAGQLFVALGSDELPWYSYYDMITTLVIGKDVTSVDIQAALAWPADALNEIQVEDGNTSYSSIDGVLFSADRASLLFYPKAKAAGTYNMPEGTTQISANSFYGCQSLTSIVIPGTIASIDDGAFNSCDSLREITFAGNAPAFGKSTGGITSGTCFNGITATAYYPADNQTWTADIMQNYGGNITWEPY